MTTTEAIGTCEFHNLNHPCNQLYLVKTNDGVKHWLCRIHYSVNVNYAERDAV